jgi:hypothetical protein
MADNNNNQRNMNRGRILRPRAEINYFPRRRIDHPNDANNDDLPDRAWLAVPDPDRRGDDLPANNQNPNSAIPPAQDGPRINPPANPDPRLNPGPQQANGVPINGDLRLNPLVQGGPRINGPNKRDPRLNPGNHAPRLNSRPEEGNGGAANPPDNRDPRLNPRPQPAVPNHEDEPAMNPNPEPAPNNGNRIPTNDGLFQERFNPVPAELHPRPTRQYGVRPRGVVLRIRDPPEWTRTAQGKQLLREMNRQGLFDGEIDEAYRVPAPEPVLSRFTKVCNFFYNLSSCFNTLELVVLGGLGLYMIYMFNAFAESLKTYYFITLDKKL